MSCIIMNAKPLASIADFIASLLNYGYNSFGMEAPKSMYDSLKYCKDKWGIYQAEQIYDKLHELNVMAYNGRYGREHEGEEYFEPYAPNPPMQRRECENHHEKVMPWHIQMEHRLAFLTYQLCEDATCDTPLYKAMIDLEHRLDAFIVHNSDEWQSLRWGE